MAVLCLAQSDDVGGGAGDLCSVVRRSLLRKRISHGSLYFFSAKRHDVMLSPIRRERVPSILRKRGISASRSSTRLQLLPLSPVCFRVVRFPTVHRTGKKLNDGIINLNKDPYWSAQNAEQNLSFEEAPLRIYSVYSGFAAGQLIVLGGILFKESSLSAETELTKVIFPENYARSGIRFGRNLFVGVRVLNFVHHHIS